MQDLGPGSDWMAKMHYTGDHKNKEKVKSGPLCLLLYVKELQTYSIAYSLAREKEEEENVKGVGNSTQT